jgi:hypothetical protein
MTYEIVVRGSVRGALSRVLDGFDVVPGPVGSTHFRGVVADQRELHTVLRRISSCNLQLTSVQRVSDTPDAGPDGRTPGPPADAAG